MKVSQLKQKQSISENDLVLISDSQDGGDTKNAKAAAIKSYVESGSARIIVTQASDLAGDLRSDVEYFISGEIDMGGQAIAVPANGLTISGYGDNVSKLYSNQSGHTMFSQSVVAAGRVKISNISIGLSGASAKVFELDGNVSEQDVLISGVVFDDCNSIGELSNFRRMLMQGCEIRSCGNGLVFSGDWTEEIVIDNVRATGVNGTVFSRGSYLLVAGRLLSNANIDVPALGTGYDFISANFQKDLGMQLISGYVSGAGTPLSGITSNSVKLKVRNTFGIEDNNPLGEWKVSSEAATIIDTAGSVVKAAGTTESNNSRLFSTLGENDLTYSVEGERQSFFCLFTGFITSSPGDEIQVQLRHINASTSQNNEIARGGSTADSLGRVEHISVTGIASMDKDDRIEVWVSNLSSSANVFVKEGSSLIVK